MFFEKDGGNIKGTGQDEKVLVNCKEMKGHIFQT